MKKLNLKLGYVLCMLLGLCYFSYGQNVTPDTISFETGMFGLYQKVDSTKIPICIVRGHMSGGMVSSTLMYCPPYMIETDTTTIMVYPACNYINYTCLRCGKTVSEKEKERREVVWCKEK